MDNILIKFVVDAKLRIIVNTLGGSIRIWKAGYCLAQWVTSSQNKFILDS